jgi:predicted nuclease of predicted toxin-antitoxin system
VNILLDECVPQPLRRLLVNHSCRTAQEMGWKSVKNGELLTLAEGKFDLFITADQGLAYQQNLRGRRIAILQLSTNKLRAIEAAAAQLRDAVATMSGTEFRRLEIPV